MDYAPPVGAAADAPYVDANPAAGIEGSPVPAASIEHPQREIVHAIQAAGLTPDAGDLTQLHQAIQRAATTITLPDQSLRHVGDDLSVSRVPVSAGEDTVLDVTANGLTLVCTQALTVTLPASADLWPGWHVNVLATNGTVGLMPAAADRIDFAATGLSRDLTIGEAGTVIVDGLGAGTWYLQRWAGSSGIVYPDTATIFDYTGADQTYTVPTGVNRLRISAWGATGGGDNYAGGGTMGTSGGAGYIYGEIAVTSGEQLDIIVGGPGVWAGTARPYGGGGAGASSGANSGSSGGGRSAVRLSGVSADLAAAGGSGGLANSAGTVGGGYGGGLAGGEGVIGGSGVNTAPGLGGTQTAGGAAGCGDAAAGSQYQGGDGDASGTFGGGGGGGGYFGGGGGCNQSGGGGGSSYVASLISGLTELGAGVTPGGTSDPHWASPIGVGGQAAGNPGRVVIW